MLVLTLFLLASHPLVHAGVGQKDDPCNPGNNRLQTGTFQFWSECNSTNFCTEEGTCQPKGCRSDDFPFGYPQFATDVPDKCPRGEFCPDEGSSCQPWQPVDAPCQLNRDDQCEAPPDFKDLADMSGRGINVNGSICLRNVCMWANATLGTTCVVENTPYTAYGVNGEFIDIVSRDNCRLGLYCDAATKVCMAHKLVGETCTADKECESWNCMSNGVCGIPSATPTHFGIYVYILVALGILGAMGGTLAGLYITHRKQRDIERAKRAQYWREQNAFHQNLMQMRDTARASILSLNQGSGSRRNSDDSHVPILNPAPKSGLRNYNSDYDGGRF